VIEAGLCSTERALVVTPLSILAGGLARILSAVVDKATKEVLGCSLFCHNAGEVMSVVGRRDAAARPGA
jgi:hypothetical protein